MPVDKFGNEIKRRGVTVKSDEGISLNFANKTYIRLHGESDITGNLNMALRKIENLGDPINPKDATSKEYVDNTKGTAVIGEVKDNTATIKGNLDFKERYGIKNLPTPVNEKDAATKEYIDTKPFLKVDRGIYEAKADINMDKLYTVYNIKEPLFDSHIVDKKYVDEMDKLNSAFSLKSGSYEAKGTILMKKHKLGGLSEPTQDGEATSKKYVDDLVTRKFIDENDNIVFGRDVDMEGNRIFSLPEPDQDSDPATKKYVDDLQNQYIDKRGNIKFGRNINLDNKRIFSLKDPKKDYEATNKKYVDDSITKRLQEEKDKFLPKDPATKEYVDETVKQLAGGDVLVSREGVFIKDNGHYRATAPLDIDNHKMENLPKPLEDGDAVNKKYVDGIIENLTLKQGLLRENGGFNLVDSYINMNFNNIRNVGNPKHGADAVPRSFVDDMEKKRTHIITVSTNYHGKLKKGEYQFPFGGVASRSCGFLMPQPGRIKKVKIGLGGIPFFLRNERKPEEVFLSNPFDNDNVFSIMLKRSIETDYEEEKDFEYIFKGYDELLLTSYRCKLEKNNIVCFKATDTLVNYPLFSGDYLNIKTEIDYKDVRKDTYFSVMFTFIIELDPLDE